MVRYTDIVYTIDYIRDSRVNDFVRHLQPIPELHTCNYIRGDPSVVHRVDSIVNFVRNSMTQRICTPFSAHELIIQYAAILTMLHKVDDPANFARIFLR